MTRVTVPEVTHLAGAGKPGRQRNRTSGVCTGLSSWTVCPTMPQAPAWQPQRHDTARCPVPRAGQLQAPHMLPTCARSGPQKGSPYEQGTVARTGPAPQVSTWLARHPRHGTGRRSLRARIGTGLQGATADGKRTRPGGQVPTCCPMCTHAHSHTRSLTHTPRENTDDSGTGSGEFLPACEGFTFGSRGPDAGREPRDEVSLTSPLPGRRGGGRARAPGDSTGTQGARPSPAPRVVGETGTDHAPGTTVLLACLLFRRQRPWCPLWTGGVGSDLNQANAAGLGDSGTWFNRLD